MRPQLRSEESRTPKFFKRFKDPVDAGVRIDEDAVRSAYRRWAPVYDLVFGPVFGKRAVGNPNETGRPRPVPCCSAPKKTP